MNLYGRSLGTVKDLSRMEIEYIFDFTEKLKIKRKNNVPHKYLKGKKLALIFQKSSTRTRVSFEVGMYELGGHALFLSASDIQLGRGETIADTARVLRRYVDGIMARVYAHSDIEDLIEYSKLPVINGLSDYAHPCQALADFFTIKENFKEFHDIKLAFLGDGNNVARSLLFMSGHFKCEFRIASPRGYELDIDSVNWARQKGAKVILTNNVEEAVKGANVLYTDVWASMGQEKERKERIQHFKDFQLNKEVEVLADKNHIVLHCLPAHRGEEITDEVIDGLNSKVFDQAENRLHVQKALLALFMSEVLEL